MGNNEKPTIDILSLFPDIVQGFLNSSILRRAQTQGRISLEASSLRDFGQGAFRSVDDTPFGGGPGMLFMPEVVEEALKAQLSKVDNDRSRLIVVYPSPRGLQFGNKVAHELSKWLVSSENPEKPNRICFLAGRYEGVDERILQKWVDIELSLGDFVVTGGELPSLVFVDSVVRLMPGVLGHEKSAPMDSFENGLLEEPQYTKPRNFKGLEVPEELLSGHHAQIQKYKLRESLLLTYALRPDLIEKHSGEGLPDWAKALLGRLQKRLELVGCEPLDLER